MGYSWSQWLKKKSKDFSLSNRKNEIVIYGDWKDYVKRFGRERHSKILRVFVMRYSHNLWDIQKEKSCRQMYVIPVFRECYAKNINSENIKLYITFEFTGLDETIKELCLKIERINKEEK